MPRSDWPRRIMFAIGAVMMTCGLTLSSAPPVFADSRDAAGRPVGVRP